MTNDEARMTNEIRMTNDDRGAVQFVIRISSFFRHSDFDIRHSSLHFIGSYTI